MFWSILHRTIFFELAKVFVLAMVGLTGILLFAGIFSEATKFGLSPVQIIGIIPLLIPNFLPYTLPTTSLFATCVVYGRLAADNEILAIKAAGINIIHVIWPALLLGTVASGATVGLYLDIIPATHSTLRTRFKKDVEEFLYSILKREGRLAEPRLGYVIDVKRVEGKRLLEPIFKRKDPKGEFFDIIARASEAELHVDLNKKQINVLMRRCWISNESGQDGGFVQEKIWPIDLPKGYADGERERASQYGYFELPDRIKELETRLARATEDIEAHEIYYQQQTNPDPQIQQHIKNQKENCKSIRNSISQSRAELQLRPALAFGCLCFAMVGCPVGIWFSKSDYLSAFVTCFIPIVLLYYPLMLCSINFAKGGMNPTITWGANGLLILMGLFLFRKLARN